MKTKAILISISAVVLFIIYMAFLSSSNAFSWSYWSSKVSSEGTISTKVYTVQTLGNDARLYTYTSPDGKQCQAFATSEGVGLSCY